MLYEHNLPLTQPYNEKQAKQKQRFDESFGRLRQKQKATIDKRLSRILEYINHTNERIFKLSLITLAYLCQLLEQI